MKVNNIINLYSELSRNAMAISNVMSEYINVAGKWNDDNAVVLAQWWNSGENGNASGDLQVDTEMGLRIVQSTTSGVYDGEDRIKGILNRSAYLFWVVVCRPLYSITTNQYSSAQANFGPTLRNCLNKGKDMTYVSATEYFTGNIWNGLMNDFVSDASAVFKNTVLPIQNTNGGSNDAEIASFMENINIRLGNFNKSLEAFISGIKDIMNDTPNTNEFFGVTPNIDAQIACNNLISTSQEQLQNFQENLKKAVQGYSEELSAQISNYLSTNYNIN